MDKNMKLKIKNEVPFYAAIDWSKTKDWDYVEIPNNELGGDSGIFLTVSYAKKLHNINLDHLEFDKVTRFIVAPSDTDTDKDDTHLIDIGLADDIVDTVETWVSIPRKSLIDEYKHINTQKREATLNHLLSTGVLRSEKVRDEGQKGRPSIEYVINEDRE